MKSTAIMFTLSLVTFGRAATPAEMASKAVPLPGPRFLVEDRDAAVCSDGAVWVFWTQINSSPPWMKGEPHLTRREWSSSLDLGLFCRLVAPDGSDIVSPLRLLQPVIDTAGAWTPLCPSWYVPVVADDGSAVVLATNPVVESSCFSLSPAEPPRTTTVVSVDRHGGMNRIVLRDGMFFDREGSNQQRTASFWHWYDSVGALKCIFGGTSSRTSELSLMTRSGNIVEVSPQTFHFATGGIVDSAAFAQNPAAYVGEGADAPITFGRGLTWTTNMRYYSGVCLRGSDTLVVAYLPPEGERDPIWGSRWPGRDLVIYRLFEHDLSLIDSVRVSANSNSGRDFSGAHTPNAILQRSSDGFCFFIPSPSGVAMYRLDKNGRPIRGKRTRGAFAPASEFDAAGEQLLSFTAPSRMGPAGWQTDWFGFTQSGLLCHEAAIRSEQ
jgi:hypothetical protein